MDTCVRNSHFDEALDLRVGTLTLPLRCRFPQPLLSVPGLPPLLVLTYQPPWCRSTLFMGTEPAVVQPAQDPQAARPLFAQNPARLRR